MTDATSVINRPSAEDRKSSGPKPPKAKRRQWVYALILGVVAGGIGGSFAAMAAMQQPDDVPALTRDLESRGFSSVTRVEGGGEDRMVSVPGYNPECRFLVKSDGGGGWTLTVPNSTTGEGTFEYPNPNAPQFAAKFPEQLKGCELAES